jgi:predicted RNase H-like HicB family nuclease
MSVELIIHHEAAGDDAVWWAESPDLAGFTAAAPSLAELRRRVLAALADVEDRAVKLSERMA